jgi:hypothetical protein
MKCKLKTTKGLDDMIRHSELKFHFLSKTFSHCPLLVFQIFKKIIYMFVSGSIQIIIIDIKKKL